MLECIAVTLLARVIANMTSTLDWLIDAQEGVYMYSGVDFSALEGS